MEGGPWKSRITRSARAVSTETKRPGRQRGGRVSFRVLILGVRVRRRDDQQLRDGAVVAGHVPYVPETQAAAQGQAGGVGGADHAVGLLQAQVVGGVAQQAADHFGAQPSAPVRRCEGGDQLVSVDVAGLLHLRVSDEGLPLPHPPHVEQALRVDVGEQRADVRLGHAFLLHPAADLLVAQQLHEGGPVLGAVGAERESFGVQDRRGHQGSSGHAGRTAGPGRGMRQ